MKHWTRILLLAVAAVLSVGTSKQLNGKKLQNPKIQAPPGVTLEGKTTAAIHENVNNQGCFANQRLDFRMRIGLRNDGPKPLEVHPDWVTVSLGFGKKQKKIRLTQAQFIIRKSTNRVKRSPRMAPGEHGTLWLNAKSILPKQYLSDVHSVRLVIDLGGSKLTVAYSDIQRLKTVSGR